MDNILYFNPENDLALAVGSGSYTPPAAAVALRRSGALLPFWLADHGDAVLVDSCDLTHAIRLCSQFGLAGEPVIRLDHESRSFAPWGWSRYSASLYRHHGYSEELLPRDGTLSHLRMLSHRRSSVIINKATGLPDTSSPEEAFSEEEAGEILTRLGYEAVIKSPWSSSGRGVVELSGTVSAAAMNFIRSVIRHQGSVMVEKRLCRVRDFAALYKITDGRVSYIGLSVFYLGHASAYGGNLIADQPYLESLLTGYVSPEVLWDTVTRTTEALSALLAGSSYSGYAGVDMIIHRLTSGAYAVAPCIELNLRSTMGVIALHVARHLRPRVPVIMSVGPHDCRRRTMALYDIGGIPQSPFSILIEHIAEAGEQSPF